MLHVSSEIVVVALTAAGVFTLALGVVHLVIPLLMDFDHAIPRAVVPPRSLRTLRLLGQRYEVRRTDVRGIAWVMSNAASYVLITLGIADLTASVRLATDVGRVVALWAAGWWAIRATSQFALGRRRGDAAVAAWFAILAALHVVAAGA